MEGNLFLNSDDQKFNFGLVFFWTTRYNIIMEYQKIINLLDDAVNQSSKFRTRNWIEINDESQGYYNDEFNDNNDDNNNNINFKRSMIRSIKSVIM